MFPKKEHKSQTLPSINQNTKSSNTKQDYLILLDKLNGGMKFNYLMIDNESQSLSPVVGRVCWAWLNNWINFRACVLKNCLYLIGGRDRSTGKLIKKVMKYNPSNCRWTECANIKQPRTGHTATAFNEKIWVIGKNVVFLSCNIEHVSLGAE